MAWVVLLQLGLLAASLIASHYLAPKAGEEAAKAATMGQFLQPRADEGEAIPLLYGTGPYRVTKFAPDSMVELERVDTWWGGHVPVKKVRIDLRTFLTARGVADEKMLDEVMKVLSENGS